jgi:hypothetical protein
MNNKELPYSYHTFLFPFIWKTNPEIQLIDFEDILQIGTIWLEAKWAVMTGPQDFDVTGKSNEDKEEIEKRKAEWFENYAADQYFTTAANNAIFNSDGDGSVVRCYQYNGKCGKYIIKKVDNDGKSYEFQLDINRIRLNVYASGIAIIIFEMENHTHKTLDAVNMINEYGRRINFPFLTESKPKKESESQAEIFSHALCANSITIQFEGKGAIIEDFGATGKNIIKHIKGDKEGCNISFSYVMRPIQDILDNGSKKITSNPAHAASDPSKFLIIPCVDDRMYVCCMVLDEQLSRELQGIGNDEISFLSDTDARIRKINEKYVDVDGNDKYENYEEGWSDEKSLSSRLYKLIYIEKDLSCQDNTMKHDLLKSSMYRRWINKGTIYGITHHSIVCVNNGTKEIKPSVIDPFLTLYVQMAVLTLAQRSLLLMLENEAARISNGFSDTKEITLKDLENIEKLMAKYVKVQNQMLLSEITVQEQGVEIYEMLRKQLYIPQNMNDLSIEMSNLRDTANIANERMERRNEKLEEEQNQKLERLATIAGIVISAAAIAEPISQMIADNSWIWTVVTIILGVLGAIGWTCLNKHYKKKNKD